MDADAERTPSSSSSSSPSGERSRVRRRRRRSGEGSAAEESKQSSKPGERVDRFAIGIFAFLTVAAPLGFGAVDQLVQVGLLCVFALGLYVHPPQVVAVSRRLGWLVLATLGLLVLKEFLPAPLFGGTKWREVMTESYSLTLPWTHHPEPGRAVDGLLAGSVAALWFLWVRTLAASRANRAAMAWTLFTAAAIVAGVSFLTRETSGHIYGRRYTPGWRGFGPFPNRNHTASFLAMGTLLGFGCLAWAGARRHYRLLAAGVGLLGLNLAALMATQSRGGLVALGAGCVVLVGLLLWKMPNRRAASLIGATAFAAAGLIFAFGAPLFARFNAASSEASNANRVGIWSDALTMWRDAPLFGHGLGSFPSVFPLYHDLPLDNQAVLHPESSWLQWLTELGALPVLLAVCLLVLATRRHLPAMFERRHGFYLMSAALAAVVALLLHGAIDVPAHRWATAAFALAALALAFPAVARPPAAPELEWDLQQASWQRAAGRSALVPLALATFWSLPLLAQWPAWAPESARLLVARATGAEGATPKELDEHLAAFPLSSQLHQLRGYFELLRQQPATGIWLRHFQIAQKLAPGSWELPVAQARACLDLAPRYAISFWQQAVERGGRRSHELLALAVQETAALPEARAAWVSYVQAHPSLELAFARTQPAAETQSLFEHWWRERGQNPAVQLEEAEFASFYELAPKWLTPEQFNEWMRRFAARTERDHRAWATVWHAWGEDEKAWWLLAKNRPDLAWPTQPASASIALLEVRSRVVPNNMMLAQNLATSYFRAGQLDKAAEYTATLARRPGVPTWFIRKAAYLLHAQGDLKGAVEVLLLEPNR